jgi:transcriptional regulator NrdR family protein
MADDDGIRERGINCPKCKTCREWRVGNTVPQDDEIWRYRVCQKCGYRLRTIEKTLGKWLENATGSSAKRK